MKDTKFDFDKEIGSDELASCMKPMPLMEALLYQWRSKEYNITRRDVELIINSYDLENGKLPSVKEMGILANPMRYAGKGFNENLDLFMKRFAMREMNLHYGFPILTEEFLFALKTFFEMNKITKIDELHSGLGYFSHWMKQFRIPVQNTIDNMSWKPYKDRYLDFVQAADSCEWVIDSDAELFVMSWPYMDDTAFRTWNNMKSGAYLLYIGEGEGGCTANDEFFTATDPHEINLPGFSHVQNMFLSFEGIHDRPVLYKKP